MTTGTGDTMWLNKVSFEVQDQRTSKLILNNVTTKFCPGITAIMGPSGSGKTSLLDAMVGKLRKGTVYGDILMENVDVHDNNHRMIEENSGYVTQLATPWDPTSTAREVLMYQAGLRLSKLMCPDEVHDRIAKVVTSLKMETFMDTVIGSATGGGISGGEKRKLAIAIQLLTAPHFLILDEPTSGLDAATTLDLLQTLKALSKQGHTVILTIHQPRPECWNLFDEVLLLAHGSICFSGKALAVQSYMATLAMHDPVYQRLIFNTYNPADSVLDALQHEEVERVAQTTYANLASTKQFQADMAEHFARFHSGQPMCARSSERGKSRWKSLCDDLQVIWIVHRRLVHATFGPWKTATLSGALVAILFGALFYRNAQSAGALAATFVIAGTPFAVGGNRRGIAMIEHTEVVKFDLDVGVVKNWHYNVALYGWYFSSISVCLLGTCTLAFSLCLIGIFLSGCASKLGCC